LAEVFADSDTAILVEQVECALRSKLGVGRCGRIGVRARKTWNDEYPASKADRLR
jgi:hypothetical protein